MKQYDVWGGWEELRGKQVLIVLRTAEVPAALAGRFASIEKISPESGLPIYFSGEVLHSYYFFSGNSYDGSIPPLPTRR